MTDADTQRICDAYEHPEIVQLDNEIQTALAAYRKTGWLKDKLELRRVQILRKIRWNALTGLDEPMPIDLSAPMPFDPFAGYVDPFQPYDPHAGNVARNPYKP